MSNSRIALAFMLLVCLSFAGCPPPAPPVTVPNLADMTQATASDALVTAGLTVGTITTASSNSVAVGHVISQNPAAGASAASGSAVNFVVSSGPATVSPSVAWSYAPTSSSVWGLTIDQTADGGFIVGGGYTGYKMYALKISSTGAYQWDGQYSNLAPPPNNSELWRHNAFGIQQIADGGYIMVGAGHNWNDSMPDKSYLLVKLDSTGNVVWGKPFAPDNPASPGNATIMNYAAALCITADGSYTVLGNSHSTQDSASILKTNSAGTLTFTKVINDQNQAYNQLIQDGQQTADGGYVLAGYSSNAPEGYTALLIKVDGSGNSVWSKKYQYAPDDYGATAYAVTQTADNGYLIGGQLVNSILNNKNLNHGAWIAKVNSTGTVVWSRSYEHVTTLPFVYDIKETPAGDFVAVGNKSGHLTLSKFTSVGDLLWNYEMSQFNHVGQECLLTSDGACVIVASGHTGGPTVIVKVNNVFVP